MPLSRLENFLKNAEGNILYVNPSDFDSTDGFENQGNSLTRPFKTIQRALIEAARFSYQQGRNNDKIDRTTILVYPGTHYIDNRPGFSVENISGNAVYKQRTAAGTWTTTFLNEFGRNTNYDILDPNNDLYKFNSVHGGVILPRGTSIIGLDLRKTKIRPLYVPDPEDDTIENSSIFNVTGTCYFSTFTFFDADLNKFSYKNYTTNQYVPNYSHHKLVSFAYGDGVNKVALANSQTNLTDLDMYYFKVAKAYGDLTGRGIIDYPSNLDFEPSVDEYRIVGTLEANPLGISSITYGDGVTTPSNVITVTTSDFNTGEQKPHGLFVDSPVYIDGIEQSPIIYNGSFTVKEVVGLTTFTYVASGSPTGALSADDFSSATVSLESDTVTSASPYVFNCSLRSVYGLSGMWADGNKADGFKSMVVAQFTGVSLQKDDNAFMIYLDGNYEDDSTLSVNSPERPLHSNAKAKFKPSYENFHVRASNNAFIQCVSIFAIGYSRHFLTESGGDMSITNSNSNFGSVSLESSGFRNESFDRDDVGYITHVIPPRELDTVETEVSWVTLDTTKTVSVGNTSRLYLFGYSSKDIIPSFEIDGYRVGAKHGELLNLTLTSGQQQVNYTTPILMTVPSGTGITSKKSYRVLRSGIYNSIDANGVFSLNEPHQLHNGESIRVFSANALSPDGLQCDKIYYAITNEVNNNLTSSQIQLAFSLNDAIAGTKINNINNNGGELTIVSSVSDKSPGQLGHPIQWDEGQKNWYVVGSATTTTNKIYHSLVTTDPNALEQESPSTFITRKLDNRSIEERVYKLRYVVPKEFEFARPPQSGFIIQETKTVDPSAISFNSGSSITASTPPSYLRNEKIISNASTGAVVDGKQVVTITTEKRHNFIIGDKIKIKKVISENNPTGVGLTSTYNGSYYITSVPNSKQFTYEISGVKINPGAFKNQINERDTRVERDNLPLVSREEYKDNYFVYRVSTVKEHIPGVTGQDGVYHIIALAANVSADENINFGLSGKKFNPDVRNLYPQIDRDNFEFDPLSSVSSADAVTIGKVVTNDKRKSITRESLDYFLKNNKVGFGITGISASGVGNTTVTIFTDIEHGLNGIKQLQIDVAGAGYGNTTIYASNLVGAAGTGASARITLTSGSVSGVEIVDPGTLYAVGNQLTVSAPSGITPTTNSLVSVSEINNNINHGLYLGGFKEEEFNGVYRILSVPGTKAITIFVPTNTSTPVINPNMKNLPYASLSSNSVGITSFKFSDVSSGIVTVTTSFAHGLLPGNKFTIVGSGTTVYDGSFVVENNISVNSFDFIIYNATSNPSSTNGILLKNSYSSNGLALGDGEQNLGGRCSYIYAGLTTTTSVQLNQSSSTITLTSSNGFSRGDYVVVNDEIIRIASTPSSNTVNVLRGQFGTLKTTAVSGTQVKKVRVIPVELRRPSFMRASGHTFEYLGYGPGNYSTGMPQKQTTVLSPDDVLVSQARKLSGGIVVYTGMNDLGEFFSGSKKLSSNTGEESVIEAPIITYTGDDARSDQSKKLSGIFDDLLIRERLTVEGGENNNQSSQFYGPVNFTQKLTNTSDFGIVTKNLFVKGKLPQGKLLTVGIGTTSQSIKNEINSSKIGDIVLQNTPTTFVGATYDGSEWKRFGLVSQTKDILDIKVDRLGIGDTSLFIPYGGVGDKELYVAGDAIFQRVTFTGETVFDAGVTLNDVNFKDINVKGTARFDIDPGVAVTSYTQVHKDGASLLNDLEVAGISTYRGVVDFQSNITGVGATFGNVRVGFIGDNEIDTSTGNLILDSSTGNTIIDDDVFITNGDLTVTTGTAVTTGLSTTRVINSTILQVGLSTVGFAGTSSIQIFDREDVGLEIKRSANVGTGSSISEVVHYGLSDFRIVTSQASDLKIFTNSLERVRVGSSGTVTYFQNNNGQDLRGAHLRLTQAGSGDVALSWDTTFNNINRRWYAGIDTSDSYSWKLASPGTTVGFGSERFDTTDETKIKVETDGNVSIAGTFNINGRSFDTIAALRTNKQTFNLVNDTVLTLNIAQAADNVLVLPATIGPRFTIRSLTDSSSRTSGALVVSGGAGIDRNLYVGELLRVVSNVQSTNTTNGSFVVTGGAGIGGNINIGGNASIGGNFGVSGSFTLTGDYGVGGNILVAGNSRIGGISTAVGPTFLQNTLSVTGETTVSNTLSVTGATTLLSTLSVSGSAALSSNLGVSGNTNINGTLTVVGFTTLSSRLFVSGITTVANTLDVTGDGTFNSSLTVVGSDVASTNFFRVQNNSGSNRFVVDSANGNTTISGTLGVTGATTLGSDTSVGGNLSVSGNGTFNQSLSVVGSDTPASNFFRVQNGSGSDRFVVDSANGNTTISGTLGVTGASTLGGNLIVNGNGTFNENLTLVGSDNASQRFFKVQNNSQNDQFVVDSANGNTTIVGTLSASGNASFGSNASVAGNLTVTGDGTFNSSLTVVGSDTASTNFFRVQNNSGTNRFTVDSANGNTTISGTLDVTGATTLSSTLGVTGAATLGSTLSVASNTTVGGTLSVTNDGTFNSSLTVVGSDTASTNFFRVQNNSGTNRFVVDSANGNTTISGTLGVTGATTLGSTLGVTGAATLSSSLDVTGNGTFNQNLTLVGSDTALTNFFKVQNNSGVDKFVIDSANGNTTISGNLTVNGTTTFVGASNFDGSSQIDGSLNVTGDFSVNTNKFNVASASGNTTVAGTLGVTGATTLSSTLSVSGATTLSSTLGVTGATTLSSTLSVSGATTLSSTLGVSSNATVGGTLGVTGNTTLSGTLSVTNDGTFNSSLTVVGSDTASTNFFRVQNNSGTNRFVVDSANGNTTISGTLGVTGATTLSSTLDVTGDGTFNSSLTVVGSDTASTNFFRVQNNSGTNRFVVDSANGNTTISGTLGVTGNTALSGTLSVTNTSTFNNTIFLVGSNTASTEYFKIQNASATDRFVVDSANGNTTISGTLDVTGATTLGSTLGVTGAATLSSTLSVTGATTLSSTLGVTGATTLSSLSVTGDGLFNTNLTLRGSNTAATNYFIVQNESASPKFTVDSANGNTSISGTLNVTGNTTLGGTLSVTSALSATTGSFTDGSIELTRSAGAFIDFKTASSEDYDVRIDNFTVDAITISSIGGAGKLRVQDDIIAFVSDSRLKTNIEYIDNALEKVCSLSGFTYTFNEVAQSLGLRGDERHVGVSAQEVQRVVPEAIRTAPISDKCEEDYLTVQYDKLVPLLIEAIKELKAEIDELKRSK